MLRRAPWTRTSPANLAPHHVSNGPALAVTGSVTKESWSLWSTGLFSLQDELLQVEFLGLRTSGFTRLMGHLVFCHSRSCGRRRPRPSSCPRCIQNRGLLSCGRRGGNAPSPQLPKASVSPAVLPSGTPGSEICVPRRLFVLFCFVLFYCCGCVF